MRNLYVYLHTHWDREWYEPFESFRTKLLRVVAKVVQDLKSGALPLFYLDGQAIVLEDSTQVCPQLSDDLKSLMKTGKLAAGPWYVLADEMLVSGESLIRNLQIGIKTTSSFGPVSKIGYCPDTFGHSQDLPCILAGFGIETAVVWRGVPSCDSSPVFWWQSPDGSRVLSYHLSRGYYQTALHENLSSEKLREFLLPWIGLSEAANGSANTYCESIGGALFPGGADHTSPPRNARRVLEAAARAMKTDGVEIVPVQLSEFLDLLKQAAGNGGHNVCTISGELRDNKKAKIHERAYLLPGVLSTRLYLKRENRAAEHRLAAIDEPLLTLMQIEGRLSYPSDELAHCWQLLLLNHAHDSICGCSIDEVHDEMQTRSRRVNNALDGLDCRARDALAGGGQTAENVAPADPAFQSNRLIVYNLSGSEISAPVPVTVAMEPAEQLPGSDDLQVLSRRSIDQLFTGEGLVAYYKQVDLIDCLVWAPNVPPLGAREFTWPLPVSRADRLYKLRTGKRRISNAYLSVEMDELGELLVTDLQEGVRRKTYCLKHRIKDVGDAGDTYNFDPLAGDSPVYAEVRSVSIGKRGPLEASLRIVYELDIPEGLERSENQAAGEPVSFRRSRKKIKHLITTEITLQRGSPILYFETSWENRSRDHRLEVLFDTGGIIPITASENHFSIVKRLHDSIESALPVPEGCEAIPDRFPCQRFVIAGDHLFFNRGLPEYGVSGTIFSITILRAVSMLSRGRMRTRGGGAGPHLEVPGANSLGQNRVTYGWAPRGGELSDPYWLAERFEGRLFAGLGRRETKEQKYSLLRVDNDKTRQVALYCDPSNDFVYLRLLNITEQSQSTRLRIDFPCREVAACRLDETEEKQLFAVGSNGAESGAALISLEFGANQLKTIRIRL